MNKLFKEFIMAGVNCEKTPENIEIFEQALRDLDTCIDRSEAIFIIKKAIRDLKGGKKVEEPLR